MADSSASSSSLITTKQPVKSLNRQVVLEEDEYTEALSKIIARDFFPSLAHLEATNTFLSSLDSQDPEKIQESVRRLSDLRATPQHRTPHAQATPYGRTPYDTPLRTPRVDSSSDPTPSKPAVDLALSLDAFQAKYTSEDNSSFTEILDEENRQRRQKYAWAWDAERRATEKKAKEIETRERLLLEAADEPSSQRLMVEGHSVASIEAPKDPSNNATDSDTPVNPGEAGALALSRSNDTPEFVEIVDVMAPRKDRRSAAVPGWRFKTRNSLMFSPDADVSPYQPPQVAAGKSDSSAPAKEEGRVVHASTRLPEQSEEVPSVPPSPTRSRIGAAISGTPYPRKADDTPKVGGYGFVDALPSPSPSELGPDAVKELMTWGTLLATPRVISNEEDDGSNSRSANPFNIAMPSNRDTIGRKLGSQASRSLRDKAALLSSGVIGVGITPGGDRKRKSDMPPPAFTPRRSGVANANMLSPAARTLLGRTKSGGALGLSPRPPASLAIPPHTLGNKRARKGKEVDLSKVGWSPSSTPVPRSRRDR